MRSHEQSQFKCIGLLVLACAVLSAARSARGEGPTTLPAAAQTIAVPASIEAYWSADLYAKATGYVTDVKVDLGDHVKERNVMAVLPVPELEKGVAHAKATLAAKKQMLRAAEASVVQSRQALTVAQKQLESYKIDVEYQQVTLKRQQELSAGSAVTPQQLDDVRNKAEMAKAGAAVSEAKIGAAQADIQLAEANRDIAAAQVEVASAAVEEARTLLDYTEIKAPFDGIVTRRQVSIGDLVQAATNGRGAPLFTVQQIDTVRVFCDLPELKASGVSVGDRADVKVYGLDGQVIVGKIKRLATSLNPVTRTMRVEIDLDNPGEALRPGMYAQVTLTVRPVARLAEATPPK